MSDCLIELGTEELPPKALLKLSRALTDGIQQGLAQASLDVTDIQSYAAPRRLGVLLRNVPLKQEDQIVEKRGPALQAAFDEDGNPTRAAQGFAGSCGVSVDQLQRKETDKGTWLYFEKNQPGQAIEALLPGIVSDALNKLPIPKRMRWGDRDDEFVRPVHWLVMMLDDQVIPCTILGAEAGNQSYGHRFHAPDAITLSKASEYAERMSSQGFVIADFEERRDMIRQQVEQVAAGLGGKVNIEEELLDEVTALVEWPVAISGRFDDEFLSVPQEALVTTMQDNQKYFAVFDPAGALMPYFITVANIDSKQPELVSAGNERVIRPRFADAKFFWNQDRKVTLSSRLQSLENVVFQQKLGTIGDKVIRIRALAGYLAEILGTEVSEAERAAELCKCDLVTDMVGEFPKLQGIMGRYYADHDGEDKAVSEAIEQHYWPRFAGDSVPVHAAGQFVALADRVDTILGIFAIGQKPTGDKDPFGLRRAALGIIRIIVENDLPLDVEMLFEKAASGLADKVDAKAVVPDTIEYIFDRLQAFYQDRGVRSDVIESVLVCRPTILTELDGRIMSVNDFLKHEAAPDLAAANKRISNILKKNEQVFGYQVDEALFVEEAEKELFKSLNRLETIAMGHFNGGEYLAGLEILAELRPMVDRFFEDVMVMVEDPKLKVNRLALLQKLANNFLRVADFSVIQ